MSVMLVGWISPLRRLGARSEPHLLPPEIPLWSQYDYPSTADMESLQVLGELVATEQLDLSVSGREKTKDLV